MVNLKAILKQVELGYVSKQKHPEFDLFIYNYTPKTQYDGEWNEVTKMCRGLILDSEGTVIARPFSKFFNLGEHEPEEIPNEPFEVFEKMDGSLGICFHYGGRWNMATRGSFQSDQAKQGQEMLNDCYLKDLRVDHTFLFEIIYRENRIVVDYGGDERLVMLGAINKETGEEMPRGVLCSEHFDWDIVEQVYNIKDIYGMQVLDTDGNKEGFVIRFEKGFRVKVKFDEYVRLHRILTNITSRKIWELLKDKEDFEDILDRVPDEFYKWVKGVRDYLENQYGYMEAAAYGAFVAMYTEDRKEFALRAVEHDLKAVIFAMYDKKEYDQIIWKRLKPESEKPFRNANHTLI